MKLKTTAPLCDMVSSGKKPSPLTKIISSAKQCLKAIKLFARRRRVESVKEEEVGDQVRRIVQSLSLASIYSSDRRMSSATTDTWLDEIVDNIVNEKLELMIT